MTAFLSEKIAALVLLLLAILYQIYRDEVAAHIKQSKNISKIVDIFSISLILSVTLSIYLFLKFRHKLIRLKYRKQSDGYYIHKLTKKPFCPTCLAEQKCYENELTQNKEKNYLYCEAPDCNYAHNPPFPDISQGKGKAFWDPSEF